MGEGEGLLLTQETKKEKIGTSRFPFTNLGMSTKPHVIPIPTSIVGSREARDGLLHCTPSLHSPAPAQLSTFMLNTWHSDCVPHTYLYVQCNNQL